MSKNYFFKILTAGEGGVGKTTLLCRYVDGQFKSDTKMTVGVQFFAKEVILSENHCILQIWDFGGQEHFRTLLKDYIAGAKGALLLFDLTRPNSLNNIEEWVKICRGKNEELPILFIGTKLDLVEDRIIDPDYISEIRERHGFFDYIEISSKTGENVKKAFRKLVKKILSC
ncbi:MAG: GTP-binding protein [Candidatus Lokiarchaeota archaeon]|nr:GTP-binding protein [Candidatus Lokiarchaeota archaeon]MBD3199222.1 GTP-binding protein [Candidatus Lokiarchaeota archaeon]